MGLKDIFGKDNSQQKEASGVAAASRSVKAQRQRLGLFADMMAVVKDINTMQMEARKEARAEMNRHLEAEEAAAEAAFQEGVETARKTEQVPQDPGALMSLPASVMEEMSPEEIADYQMMNILTQHLVPSMTGQATETGKPATQDRVEQILGVQLSDLDPLKALKHKAEIKALAEKLKK